METLNQRTDAPVDFTSVYFTADCQKQPSEVFYKKAVLKNFAISTRNTCVRV